MQVVQYNGCKMVAVVVVVVVQAVELFTVLYCVVYERRPCSVERLHWYTPHGCAVWLHLVYSLIKLQ